MKSTALPATIRKTSVWADITIPLVPVPAARPQVLKSGHTYYPKRYTTWMKDVAHSLSAIEDELRPVDDTSAFEVRIRFYIEPFKSVQRAWTKGDLDNYVKSVMDAITKQDIIWKDDVQVTRLKASKYSSQEPGIEVTIITLTEKD